MRITTPHGRVVYPWRNILHDETNEQLKKSTYVLLRISTYRRINIAYTEHILTVNFKYVYKLADNPLVMSYR